MSITQKTRPQAAPTAQTQQRRNAAPKKQVGLAQTIDQATVLRATPRELRLMLADALQDELTKSDAVFANAEAAEDAELDELDLADGPDDDADAEPAGEPEPEELAAFEASLLDADNLPLHPKPALTLSFSDYYVFRIDPAEKSGGTPRCTHIAKPWLRFAGPGGAMATHARNLCFTLDAMAGALAWCLPQTLANPQPDALLQDWTALQQADGGHYDPWSQVGWVSLVFSAALEVSGRSTPDTKDSYFSGIHQNILLYWSDTQCTMPLRSFVDPNGPWVDALKRAAGSQTSTRR